MASFDLENNPFQSVSNGPVVYVAVGDGPYNNTRTALANIDLSVVQEKRILLKPNAGRIAEAGSGIVTHPQVVAAAIDAFTEAGAEVVIGESPIVGVKTLEAFESMGVTATARERNCPLIDMDARPFVEMEIPNGLALHALKVCPEIFEFDVIVSLPVMKMHMHTGVTLSIKNMKGCLWRRTKVGLHMLPPVDGHDDKPIDIAIADLSSVLRPHLTIIDGTVGMEGLGPSAGKAKPFGVVVVGVDAFAADAVACRLMGTDAHKVPHLRIGSERGYGVIDLEQIDVVPENWLDFIDPFSPPPANLSIEFPGIKVLDKNSCSSCQSTLLLFIKRYGEKLAEYFPDEEKIVHFAIGAGNDEVPDGTFCVGNCTAKHRKSTWFIPGCPPVASQILSAVSHKPSVDEVDGHAEPKESQDSQL